MAKIDLKPFLGQNAHWQVNKKIASMVGIEAALFLSYLIDKDGFFSKSYVVIGEDEYFFLYSEDIEVETTLSYKVQKKCISILESEGMIKTKLMGIPRKLYFALCKLHIFQKVTYINAERSTIEMPKSELIYKEQNNKESILKKEYKEKPKSFKTFSIEDFQNEIKLNRGAANFSAQDCIDFHDYWTETDANGKMRFTREITWNTDKRMLRWKKNDRTQINGQKTSTKTTKEDVMNGGKDLLLKYAELERQKMGNKE